MNHFHLVRRRNGAIARVIRTDSGAKRLKIVHGSSSEYAKEIARKENIFKLLAWRKAVEKTAKHLEVQRKAVITRERYLLGSLQSLPLGKEVVLSNGSVARVEQTKTGTKRLKIIAS